MKKIKILLLTVVLSLSGCEDDFVIYVQKKFELFTPVITNDGIQLTWNELNYSEFNGPYNVYRLEYNTNFYTSTLIAKIYNKSITRCTDHITPNQFSTTDNFYYYVKCDTLETNYQNIIVKDNNFYVDTLNNY